MEPAVEAAVPEAEGEEVTAEPVEAAGWGSGCRAEQVPEEELVSTFDELFALRPDVLEGVEPEEDEEEEDEDQKKKKKKKKKFVEMTYDPEKDVVIAKKKRKRGGVAWEDDWDL
jgi:N utilization substance protein A